MEKRRQIDEWVKQDGYAPYTLEHPLWDEVDDAVVHIMCEYGPDGHCDGHHLITAWILEQYKLVPWRDVDGEQGAEEKKPG